MPECVLQAYFEQLPRLRAERALEAAGVGALPWIKERDQQRWYDAQRARLNPEPMPSKADAALLPFTFNGIPMGKAALKARVAQVLGAGFST